MTTPHLQKEKKVESGVQTPIKQMNVSSTFHKMVFCAKVERMVT